VWSGFRVARRANIGNRIVGKVTPDHTVQFAAAHNGYKKQGINCIHHRAWNVSLSSCIIDDVLTGDFDSAIGYLHLHPKVVITYNNENTCTLLSGDYEIELEVTGAKLAIEESTWHPEFGIIRTSKKLSLQYNQSKVNYKINWKKL
jgi:uncharacterized heparinase superfamily protein